MWPGKSRQSRLRVFFLGICPLFPLAVWAGFDAPSPGGAIQVQPLPLQIPSITGYSPSGCITPGGLLTINGTGFGSSAAGRGMAMGGNGQHVDLQITSWSGNRIVAKIPSNRGLKPGKRYYVGMEKANHSQWLSNINRMITICAAEALPAAPRPELLRPGGFAGTVIKPAGSGSVPPPPPEESSEGWVDDSSWEEGGAGWDSSPGVPGSFGSLISAGLPPPPQVPELGGGEERNDVEPAEILLLSDTMEQAIQLEQQLSGLGVMVKRRTRLPGLGLVITTFRLPQGMGVGAGLNQVRGEYPDLWVEANHRYGLLQGKSYGTELIGWPGGRRCGSGRTIGLLDTGVDTSHPALRGADLKQHSLLSRGIFAAAKDHGTAIAGLLVGQSEAHPGLVPGARLRVGAVFRARDKRQETTAEWVVKGLDWLVRQRVDVINLSLGGPRSLLLEAALARVLARGVPVVAAAGNSAGKGEAIYPAAQDGVIAVVAVDARKRPYKDSSRGDYIDFAAPGVDVWVARPGRDGLYRSGSSYAAPYVAAVILALGEGGAEPYTLLKQQAQDLGAPGRDPLFGWGLISAKGVSCRGGS
jgi:hypothetical protein